MMPFAGINSSSFSSRVIPAAAFDRAVELHELEEYAASSNFIEPLFSGARELVCGEKFVPLGRALVLHAWNLFYSKQFEALSVFLGQIEAEAREVFPELRVVEWSLLVQIGSCREVLDQSNLYICDHLDPIPAHLAGYLFVNGIAASKLGLVEQSVTSLEHAYAISSLVANDYWSGIVSNYLGYVHMQTSAYLNALHWLDRARTIFVRRKLPRKLSMVNLNAGITRRVYF